MNHDMRSHDASCLPPARILYLTRIYPYRPAFGGDVAYSRGVVESVGGACELTALAATNGEIAVGEHRQNGVRWILVPASRRRQSLSLTSAMPNIMWRNATAAYHAALERLLAEDWDGIVIDHFASAHVLPQLVEWRSRHPGARLLYLSHEHEKTTRSEKYASYSGGPLRLAAMRIDGYKIGRWEEKLLDTVDIVSLINPREKHLFGGQGQFVVTLPGYDGPRVAHRRIDAEVPRRVALLGGRGPLHKRNILADWLAASARTFADAGVELDVIGDVEPRLRAELSQRYPQVRFSGFVEDLAAHLQTCRLGVVPDTVGRGVKIRLTSYIFARVPMFGYKGAIDGLPLVPSRDFLEAPDQPNLATLCVRHVDDFDLLDRLQRSAFAACDGKFAWADRGPNIVGALLGDGGGRRGAPDPVGDRFAA